MCFLFQCKVSMLIFKSVKCLGLAVAGSCFWLKIKTPCPHPDTSSSQLSATGKAVLALSSASWSTAFIYASRDGCPLSLNQIAPSSQISLRVSVRTVSTRLHWQQLPESMVLLYSSVPQLLSDLSHTTLVWPDAADWPTEELILYFQG